MDVLELTHIQAEQRSLAYVGVIDTLGACTVFFWNITDKAGASKCGALQRREVQQSKQSNPKVQADLCSPSQC